MKPIVFFWFNFMNIAVWSDFWSIMGQMANRFFFYGLSSGFFGRSMHDLYRYDLFTAWWNKPSRIHGIFRKGIKIMWIYDYFNGVGRHCFCVDSRLVSNLTPKVYLLPWIASSHLYILPFVAYWAIFEYFIDFRFIYFLIMVLLLGAFSFCTHIYWNLGRIHKNIPAAHAIFPWFHLNCLRLYRDSCKQYSDARCMTWKTGNRSFCGAILEECCFGLGCGRDIFFQTMNAEKSCCNWNSITKNGWLLGSFLAISV